MSQLSPLLEEKLSRCCELPTLPAAAAKILDLAQNPVATMGQVADVVGMDPALATKLLRIANSPLYGQRRQSSNLRQAVMLMGLNSTLMLALSFSLYSSLSDNQQQAFDYTRFWRRSLLASIAARILAAETSEVSPEDAFLAALLQDIGMAVLDKALDGFYPPSAEGRNNHDELLAHEMQQLGHDHASVGAWLLERWSFPAHLAEAVSASHQLSPAFSLCDVTTLADCIALSGRIADGFMTADGRPPSQADDPSSNLSGSLEAVLDATAAEIPAIEELFNMSLIDGQCNDGLLSHAKEVTLIRSLHNSEQIEHSLIRLKDAEERAEQLEEATRRDHLTGVWNRSHFDNILKDEFLQSRKNGWPLSVLFIDLDKFKNINDSFGHAFGDQVLRFAANILKSNIRSQDSVFRFGGEEFVLILPGSDTKGAKIIGARIVEAFRNNRYPTKADTSISLSASVGMATLDGQHDFNTATELLNAADMAMYRAKKSGGNQMA
ncbi:GGDEF domain-containing protein [Marinobacterium rhizophilum]|uniref:diguanylate cyclase n=1 Tax=Marinobacterium rhizophilum TaxID=420402 RepID=A0ABY5HI14_9GAMM|nr:GGDEF domain-containing protein [Marinobacterium rhizophilum]UTW10939.1 GGDEF domain-containing protein [Marinobacterium rhizophilum]